MLTDDQADERVKKGAAVLDRHGPPEWVNSIEWPSLAMGDCTKCVLGQVYDGDLFGEQRTQHDEENGWALGMRVLGGPHKTAEIAQRFGASHGFDREPKDDGGAITDYATLRAAWIRWAVFNGHAPLSVLAPVARRLTG